MAEQFLHGLDVVTRFQQVRREAVPQSVRRRRFGDPRRTHRPDQPDWGLGADVTDDGRWLLISQSEGTNRENRVFLKDLSDPNGKIEPFLDKFDASYVIVGNDGATFYVVTDKEVCTGGAAGNGIAASRELVRGGISAVNSTLHLGLVMQGGSAWAGGAEYVKNLLLATRAAAAEEGCAFRATLFTACALEPVWREQFTPLAEVVHLPLHPRQLNRWLRFGNRALARAIRARGIDFLFPLTYENTSTLGLHFPLAPFLRATRWAGWIPDFQHRHLPQFFSAADLRLRDEGITHLAAEAPAIVFSSETSARDYREFWPSAKARPFVLRFCTVPDDDWFRGDPAATQKQHALPDRFLLVSNQFWQHKNHATLFAALGILAQRGLHPHVACTGSLQDYRGKEHVAKLREQIAALHIENQVALLGLIPRGEQVQLMRRCIAVVQPSLCEGWSTVVEDARLLGKPVVLSDLAVHREQNPPGARYFARESAQELAAALADAWTALPPGPDFSAEEKARATARESARTFGHRFLRFAQDGAAANQK